MPAQYGERRAGGFIPNHDQLVREVEGAGPQPHYRRLLFGTLWTGTALVFAQGSTVLGTLVAVRLLEREAFGAYAGALATIQFGSAILSVGLGGAAMKYVAEFRNAAPERAGRFLGFSLAATLGIAVLGALVVTVSAPIIAGRVFGRPELEPLLRLAGPALLFATANLGLSAVLGGLAAFRALGRLGVWSGAAYLVLVTVGLLYLGERGAVLGIGAAALVQFSLGAWLVAGESRRQGILIRFKLSLPDQRLWREFALPSALIGLGGPAALWLIQVAIARSPGGLVALGAYLVASNLMMIVLLLPNIVYGVAATLLNERRGADDPHGFMGLFRRNLWITLVTVLIGVVTVGLSGTWLLGIFGPGFRASFPVLLVLLAATLPEALTIVLNQLLQASARMWQAFLWISLPRDLLMPLLAFVLAPLYGPMGGALAYLAGRLLAATCIVVLTRESGVSGPRALAVRRPNG